MSFDTTYRDFPPLYSPRRDLAFEFAFVSALLVCKWQINLARLQTKLCGVVAFSWSDVDQRYVMPHKQGLGIGAAPLLNHTKAPASCARNRFLETGQSPSDTDQRAPDARRALERA